MATLKESVMGFGGLLKVASIPIKDDDEDVKNRDYLAVENDGANVVLGGLHRAYGMGGAAEVMSSIQYAASKVRQYYDIAKTPEVEECIDIIINEMITVDDINPVVTVDLSRTELSDTIKEQIQDEFSYILKLMKFDKKAYQRIKSWYISGRQAFHIIIDKKHPKNGITDLVLLDPKTYKKVITTDIDRNDEGLNVIKGIKESFYYDSRYLDYNYMSRTTDAISIQTQMLELDAKSIAYVDSGEHVGDMSFVPGLLEYAIKAVNNLISMEDAAVIYMITRAPDRRAFYLDVGNMTTKEQMEYMDEFQSRSSSEITYDSESGSLNCNGTLMGIVEDIWLPRRNGEDKTEVTTLSGGTALTDLLDPVNYFMRKVYRALKVPKNRIENDGLVNIGGSDLAQTTREDYQFNQTVTRYRRQYTNIFEQLLHVQLVLKNIVDEDDWDELSENILFEYTHDPYIEEQQASEILQSRIQNAEQAEPYVGTIMSFKTYKSKVWGMSEEEQITEAEQIEKEKAEGVYDNGSPAKFKADGAPDDRGGW